MCKTLINKDFQDQVVRNCTKSAIAPKLVAPTDIEGNPSARRDDMRAGRISAERLDAGFER
jgi:hypothetical protein